MKHTHLVDISDTVDGVDKPLDRTRSVGRFEADERNVEPDGTYFVGLLFSERNFNETEHLC